MGEGSMFEEPDFSRGQPGGDGEDDVDDELDDEELADDDDDTDADDDDDTDDADDTDDTDDDDDDDDEADVEDEAEADDDEDEAEADDDEDDDDDEEEDEEGAVNRLRGAAAKAVLEHVTRTLVDDPDSVVVDVSEGRSGLRFSVHVAQGDMGRLIGRKGRTAQAIRTLVRAAAASDGTEASVDIVD
jgi:predicted RNA-binding protein YlqC (UPF0109 family)